MRRLVVDLKAQRESPITWEHYQHCLDSLRQDIMCRADDTPMPGILGGHLGNGQTVMCRDWNNSWMSSAVPVNFTLCSISIAACSKPLESLLILHAMIVC